MRIKLSKDTELLLQKRLETVEEQTNFDILKEQKIILNKCFGAEFNQISKPSITGLGNILDAHGIGVYDEGYIRSRLTDKEYGNYLCYETIVHFPEVTIKNSSTKTHNIKDLYVRFWIRQDGTILPYSLEGVRSSYTEAEYLSGYIHSHLPGFYTIDDIRFQQFCRGVGEINMVMQVLGKKFTTANFMMFCIHIKNFIEWESKEGSPYRFFQEISKSRSNPYRPSLQDIESVSSHLIVDIKELMTPEKLSSIIDVVIKPMSISVSFTKEGKEALAELMTHEDSGSRQDIHSRGGYPAYLGTIDSMGQYKSIIEENHVIIPNDKTVLKFKDKDIILNIIDPTENEQKNKEIKIYPHEEITRTICKKLSHDFIRIIIKEKPSTQDIEKYGSCKNKSETAGSNPIPMQESVGQGVVRNAVLQDLW